MESALGAIQSRGHLSFCHIGIHPGYTFLHPHVYLQGKPKAAVLLVLYPQLILSLSTSGH